MAYRFNNGRGGVTCDKCQLLIDEDLSYKEYKEMWGEAGSYCMRCKEELKNGKHKDADTKDI